MDDFSELQLDTFADDKIVTNLGPLFCVCFVLFCGPFNYAFLLSFKLRIY